MEISFKGKRALVTGAAQGIGRAIAVKLSQCGATVIALDMQQNLLDELKNEFPSMETVTADLGNWTGTQIAIKSVYPIDLLVNNAGVGLLQSLTDTTEEGYDRIFNINIKAVINVTKTVIENLLERKVPGAVVSISSQASRAGLLDHALYCASKGAVDAFTRAVALDYGQANIRFNCVNPTVVLTELSKKVWNTEESREWMVSRIPLHRFAEIEDVANAVTFLLSDKASMINGSSLAVDGGFLAC